MEFATVTAWTFPITSGSVVVSGGGVVAVGILGIFLRVLVVVFVLAVSGAEGLWLVLFTLSALLVVISSGDV